MQPSRPNTPTPKPIIAACATSIIVVAMSVAALAGALIVALLR